MHRRRFLSASSTAAAGAALTACGGPSPESGRPPALRKPVKMYVATQRAEPTDEAMAFLKRHAVEHACIEPPGPGEKGYWSLEEIERTRDLAAKHGVKMVAFHMPFLGSTHVANKKRPAIMMAKSPERDRDIELVQKMIVSLSKSGVGMFMYNLNLLGGMKGGGVEPLRGGAVSRVWRLKDRVEDPPLTKAGSVSEEMFWERITYFLDRVIPTCNEYKVRAACHPHDPPGPDEGFQGIYRVLGSPEGLKKLVSIQESPYHGLNLCLGSTCEMLEDPDKEIHDVVRCFGERKKIFNTHFRNIRGGLHDFQETFPDNGDVNMPRLARTLHEVDYEFGLMPDHVPRHPDDPKARQAFAFCFGYIKGVLQSLETFG